MEYEPQSRLPSLRRRPVVIVFSVFDFTFRLEWPPRVLGGFPYEL